MGTFIAGRKRLHCKVLRSHFNERLGVTPEQTLGEEIPHHLNIAHIHPPDAALACLAIHDGTTRDADRAQHSVRYRQGGSHKEIHAILCVQLPPVAEFELAARGAQVAKFSKLRSLNGLISEGYPVPG